MEKQYDLAVVIGRFQPIHKGHEPAFTKANEIAKKTIVIIGSANKPSTPKNPFSAEEREYMIRAVYNELWKSWTSYNGLPEFVYVEDAHYLDQEWFSRVKEGVEQFVPEVLADREDATSQWRGALRNRIFKAGVDPDNEQAMKNFVSLHGHYDQTARDILDYQQIEAENKTCRIAVLGHEKDESSYYLKNFAEWDLVDIGAWVGDFEHDKPISATDIRDLWFSGKLSYAKANLRKSIYEYLLNYTENDFFALKEEWEFLQRYRKETQVGPFPVQFMTTDAVVIHGDEVLMVRRGCMPGKGLWALPGGFKGEHETFFRACIRELLEETRIALPEKTIVNLKREEKVFDYPDRSARGTTVSMAYLFVLDPDKPRPRVKGADDAVEAWWFPLSKLKKMRDQIFEDHLDIVEYMTARI